MHVSNVNLGELEAKAKGIHDKHLTYYHYRLGLLYFGKCPFCGEKIRE